MTVDEIITLGFEQIEKHGGCVADAVHYDFDLGAHATIAHLLNGAPEQVKKYILSQIPYIFSHTIVDEKKILNFQKAYTRKHIERYCI